MRSLVETCGPARTIHSTKGIRQKCSGRITILRPYAPSLSSDMAAEHILQHVYERATASLHQSVVMDTVFVPCIEYVCRVSTIGPACVCSWRLLGTFDNPQVDPRKPLREIGDHDAFSGRTYDERYLTTFINTYRLPCNPPPRFSRPVSATLIVPSPEDMQIVGGRVSSTSKRSACSICLPPPPRRGNRLVETGAC